jgi:small acid-soluble spore protein H (minor)
MNIARAKEIAETGKTVHVTFQGTPIMIQHVNEQDGTARIYPISHPEQEQTVTVNSLQEQ